jgi:autophagy-related protein 2
MPLLKLRLVSITLKDANAKQSRIRLTLFGFTYTFHPDLAWATDLAEFVKAPPGVGPPPKVTHVVLLLIRRSSKLFRPNERSSLCPSSMDPS